MLPAKVSVFEAPAIAHLAIRVQGYDTIDDRKTRLCKGILFCLDSAEGKTKLSQCFKAAEVKPHLPLWRQILASLHLHCSAIYRTWKGSCWGSIISNTC